MAAKFQSFTRAGRELNFSQSAISQQIRELEQELDVKLFDRNHRVVTLTPAGEHLLPRATALLQEVARTNAELAKFRGQLQEVLRIGAGNTLGVYMLPRLLGKFSQAYPHVRATMRVAEEAEVLRAAQEGDLDMALVAVEPSAGQLFGWSIEAIGEDELVLVTSPDHPWAKAGRITLEELQEGTFIMRQPESPTRRTWADHLARLGMNPANLVARFEVSHTEGLKRAVMAGLGAGWVSRFAIEEELAHGTLAVVELADLRITRQLWLAVPENPTESARAFCDLLRERGWR